MQKRKCIWKCVIHMDWNAKSAYYVAGRCVLYVKALKDKEKVELFSTP